MGAAGGFFGPLAVRRHIVVERGFGHAEFLAQRWNARLAVLHGCGCEAQFRLSKSNPRLQPGISFCNWPIFICAKTGRNPLKPPLRSFFLNDRFWPTC